MLHTRCCAYLWLAPGLTVVLQLGMHLQKPTCEMVLCGHSYFLLTKKVTSSWKVRKELTHAPAQRTVTGSRRSHNYRARKELTHAPAQRKVTGSRRSQNSQNFRKHAAHGDHKNAGSTRRAHTEPHTHQLRELVLHSFKLIVRVLVAPNLTSELLHLRAQDPEA